MPSAAAKRCWRDFAYQPFRANPGLLIFWLKHFQKLAEKDRIVIVDQGLSQTLYAMAWWGSDCSYRQMGAVLESAARRVPMCLITTSADGKTVLERIRRRALRADHEGLRSWMFEEAPKEIQRRKIQQGMALTRDMADLCFRLPHVPVLALDTRLPVENSVRMCSQFVMEQLGA